MHGMVVASHCRGACRGLSSALHQPHADNLGAGTGAVTNECLGRRAALKGQGDREGAGDEGEEVARPVADVRERQAGLPVGASGGSEPETESG
jgi:hypothetical protein